MVTGHEGQHGSYCYGVRKKERESIHEFCADMNWNIFFWKIFTESLKKSCWLLLGKEKPKEVFKIYKSLT